MTAQPITLDPTIATELSGGMDSGVLELPFPVVYFWALNGQATFKSQGGALYYGGWACKVEDMKSVVDQTHGYEYPGLKQATIPTREGGEFEAYTTRSLIVAPIAFRQSWLLDRQRFSEYTEGGRQHVQVLVNLGVKASETSFESWGPAVLTAKGYQARNLMNAFGTWDKHTSALRYKIAAGVPAWCFYLGVGTFGKERVSLNVGKPGAQSPITPIGPYLPDLSDAVLSALFVKNEIAALMVDYKQRGADWLNAWKDAEANGNVDHFASQQEADQDDQGGPDNFVEDGVPF